MAITNNEIAAHLNKLADLLEVEGENPFRIHAYRRAAQLLKHLAQPVTAWIDAGKSLTDFPGIGHALDEKIREIIATGHLHALEREEKHIPPTLRDLLAVPGLGPRRIHTLYERLNIRSIGDLSAAVESGRLRTLPGFGDKLESAIRDFLSANTVPGNNTALLEPLLRSLRHDQR